MKAPSFCPACWSATWTQDSFCGKCGAFKEPMPDGSDVFERDDEEER